MRRFTLAAAVVLAGCTQTVQMPMQLTPDIASGTGIPTVIVTDPQSTTGELTVTLANGDVLKGRFTAQPKAGPNMGVDSGTVDDNLQVVTEATVTMQASNGRESIQCNGTRNIAALNVTCTMSDGSTYDGTQTYGDDDSDGYSQ